VALVGRKKVECNWQIFFLCHVGQAKFGPVLSRCNMASVPVNDFVMVALRPVQTLIRRQFFWRPRQFDDYHADGLSKSASRWAGRFKLAGSMLKPFNRAASTIEGMRQSGGPERYTQLPIVDGGTPRARDMARRPPNFATTLRMGIVVSIFGAFPLEQGSYSERIAHRPSMQSFAKFFHKRIFCLRL
jgi:hypothetical protein